LDEAALSSTRLSHLCGSAAQRSSGIEQRRCKEIDTPLIRNRDFGREAQLLLLLRLNVYLRDAPNLCDRTGAARCEHRGRT
jgi:hypothetical protein